MGGRDSFEHIAAGTVAFAPAMVVGELIALADEGKTPMVRIPSLPGGQALRARSIAHLQLCATDVGRSVVLLLERGDPLLPIVMGVLGGPQLLVGVDEPERVEITADGSCIVVSADEQLVLRCGKASITLTSAGKVLISGTYVSSRSSGVNRIKGGSVQLN